MPVIPKYAWTGDPWWIVLKRLRAARLVRAYLYGTFPEDAPCWGDKHESWHTYYCREMQWAYKIGEFVRTRSFRYSEMLKEARAMVADRGVAKPGGLEEDLELLKQYERRLYDRRAKENRWHRVIEPMEQVEIDAECSWKTYVLAGICPLCGTNLPCQSCSIPAMQIDGRGGLKAIP